MHIINTAIFPYFAQILLENALFCRQNARLKNRLFCSKFCRQNLSKPNEESQFSIPNTFSYRKGVLKKKGNKEKKILSVVRL